MPVTSEDFLMSARSLLLEDSEIAQRNAVSRAYYAVYHSLKSQLDQSGVPEFLGPSHAMLAERLKSIGLKSEAYRLTSLHRARCCADYTIDDNEYPAIVAQKHVESCASLISIFKLPS